MKSIFCQKERAKYNEKLKEGESNIYFVFGIWINLFCFLY